MRYCDFLIGRISYSLRPVPVNNPVAWSVCHAPEPCKTTERIEVLLGVETLGETFSIVLDGGPDPPRRKEEKGIRSGHHQITFAICYIQFNQ